MKKLFIIAAAAIAMTACTSEEEVFVNNSAPKEIGIGAVNYGLSRGTPNEAADGNTFSTDNTMMVTAIYYPEANGTAYNYFTNQLFSFKETSGSGSDAKNIWCCGKDNAWTPVFYPLNGEMQFMAYSSSTTPGGDADVIWPSASPKTAVLDFKTNSLNGLDDVLYSNLPDEKVKCGKTEHGVPSLTFRHALAWIYVTVKAGDATTASNLRIKDVIVNGVSLSGVATINYATTSTVTWDPAKLTTPGNQTMNRGGLANLYTITESEKAWGNGMLIPTQNMQSISIVYQVKNLGTWDNATDITYTHNAGSGKWEAGSKYTYNFTIKLDEIKVTGEVTPFSGGSTTSVEI